LGFTQRLTFESPAVLSCIELSTGFESAKSFQDTALSRMGEIVRKALIILIVLFGVFLAIGCAGNKPVTPNETGTPEQAVTPVKVATPTVEKTTERQIITEMQNVTEKSEIKEYTLKELAEYNGKNGTAYVAYQGQVYNVSDSDIWKNGTNKGCNAGTDLTGKMDKTPHGAEILKGYPVVGTLKK
jgi:predicted heme/steroid binding protein